MHLGAGVALLAAAHGLSEVFHPLVPQCEEIPLADLDVLAVDHWVDQIEPGKVSVQQRPQIAETPRGAECLDKPLGLGWLV